MAKSKKKTKVMPKNYMDAIPIRSELRPWRTKQNGMVEIDMKNEGFYNKIAQKFFHKPEVSHIALDKYGTALWLEIDGQNNVYEILQKMEQQFPDEKEKMLNRVVTFLGTLESNKFISISYPE